MQMRNTSASNKFTSELIQLAKKYIPKVDYSSVINQLSGQTIKTQIEVLEKYIDNKRKINGIGEIYFNEDVFNVFDKKTKTILPWKEEKLNYLSENNEIDKFISELAEFKKKYTAFFSVPSSLPAELSSHQNSNVKNEKQPKEKSSPASEKKWVSKRKAKSSVQSKKTNDSTDVSISGVPQAVLDMNNNFGKNKSQGALLLNSFYSSTRSSSNSTSHSSSSNSSGSVKNTKNDFELDPAFLYDDEESTPKNLSDNKTQDAQSQQPKKETKILNSSSAYQPDAKSTSLEKQRQEQEKQTNHKSLIEDLYQSVVEKKQPIKEANFPSYYEGAEFEECDSLNKGLKR